MNRKAQISTDTLEDIYELTYKYQILKQETKIGDYGLPSQLPDKAYMEFEKIKGRLAELIDHGLEEEKEIFNNWINFHKYEGLNDPNTLLRTLNKMGDLKEEFIRNEDLDPLIEVMGSNIVDSVLLQHIKNSDKKEAIINALEDDGWSIRIEEFEKVDTLHDNLRDYLLYAILQVEDVPLEDLYYEMTWRFHGTDAYKNLMIDTNYDRYPALSDIELVSEQLEEYETLSLDDKITLFQEALTTAHNTGSMADYLIDINLGGAVKFLDYLSSGPEVEQWDNELTKFLGYPPGSKAPKDEWFVPAHLKKAIKILSYNIDKNKLHTLWWEDEDGNFITADVPDNPSEIPDNAKYQVSRFPTMVNTTYLRLNPDGTSTEIAKGESSYSEDLALALAASNDFSLSEAIIIASEACERCMNALAYDYGLDWGYPEGSKEWKEANTECEFCKDIDDHEHMWAEDD